MVQNPAVRQVQGSVAGCGTVTRPEWVALGYGALAVEQVGRDRQVVAAVGCHLEALFALGAKAMQLHELLYPPFAHAHAPGQQRPPGAQPAVAGVRLAWMARLCTKSTSSLRWRSWKPRVLAIRQHAIRGAICRIDSAEIAMLYLLSGTFACTNGDRHDRFKPWFHEPQDLFENVRCGRCGRCCYRAGPHARVCSLSLCCRCSTQCGRDHYGQEFRDDCA